MIKIGTMINRRCFRWTSTENFWFPGIEMRIEVDDGDGAVGAVDGAEKGESNGVVPSQGDYPRERFAVFSGAELLCIGGRRAGKNRVVTFLNLMEGP